jgi:ABC-2 type transport system ATP-binding protein
MPAANTASRESTPPSVPVRDRAHPRPSPILALVTTTSFTTAGLGHAYGKVAALHSLDVKVPEGRIGLVGANGAGKSTLIQILLGIIKPTAGSASVLGMDTTTETIAIRSVVGYMPEGPCLPLDQTAADFLVFAAGTAGLPPDAARQRASDVLTLVGLNEERFRYLGDFSTGMKQRTKLAQAIVHDPQLVFLDEPTAGLDPSGREEMLDLIRRLGSFGIDVVVSSHVLRDIERTCDWVVMLDEGTLLDSAPIGQDTTEGTVRLEVVGPHDLLVQILEGKGATVAVEGRRLSILDDRNDVFNTIRDAAVEADVGIRRLDAGESTLEEMFLQRGGAR